MSAQDSGGSATPPVLADLGARGAALILDLVLVVATLVLVAQAGAGTVARPVVLALLVLYFVALPLTPLQGTLGKWICRIRVCDKSGNPLRWRVALVRGVATIAWLALPGLFGAAARNGMAIGNAMPGILVGFLLPWAIAGFLPRRQTLFDLLAGSIVVRHAADASAVAGLVPARPGWLRAGGFAVACLLAGAMLSAAVGAFQVHERRGRVMYAIGETEAVRKKIEAFRTREGRWPTSVELGVPETVPYRDGGSYRLGTDGSVTIRFSVIRELKDRDVVLRPALLAEGGRIEWRCRADPGLDRSYVGGMCRD